MPQTCLKIGQHLDYCPDHWPGASYEETSHQRPRRCHVAPGGFDLIAIERLISVFECNPAQALNLTLFPSTEQLIEAVRALPLPHRGCEDPEYLLDPAGEFSCSTGKIEKRQISNLFLY